MKEFLIFHSSTNSLRVTVERYRRVSKQCAADAGATVTVMATVRDFGLIGEVKDSFFFLKRLNVWDADAASAVDRVNFGPAPGVSSLWTVSPRGIGAGRVLRPSFGINVSFTDWDDPAFDKSTGQFAVGTNASDIQISAGGVFGLFDGALQFTARTNLNADKKRGYFGLGFGFVNVVDRSGKLIAKKRMRSVDSDTAVLLSQHARSVRVRSCRAARE